MFVSALQKRQVTCSEPQMANIQLVRVTYVTSSDIKTIYPKIHIIPVMKIIVTATITDCFAVLRNASACTCATETSVTKAFIQVTTAVNQCFAVSLEQGYPNCGPRGPFQPAAKTLCQSWKTNIFTKNLLNWYNATFPQTIALCKMPGPRTVV